MDIHFHHEKTVINKMNKLKTPKNNKTTLFIRKVRNHDPKSKNIHPVSKAT